ncbi:hypothetical protein K503DRAFT_138063 [Rhizopogon vinicolor AM-OR11-026]|uniref:TNFR-Cys domain-containing protein n=1 Tax=Rhizopogon vinicolor AM-OR11-026 TaxID=1314800 RepID=A0A1B7N1H9_9AGAM|nr:hypothetical protein K503DRAFT_138063 [Rhizopogon vinicolor AM-OR11-026]
MLASSLQLHQDRYRCSICNLHLVRCPVPAMAFARLPGRVSVLLDSLVHLTSRARLVSSDRSGKRVLQDVLLVIAEYQAGRWHQNGTQCATCASGFFLDTSGSCEICQLGYAQCADGIGDCITCSTGFTQDANDRTKCDAIQQITTGGTVCPDGSYSAGSSCQACSPLCQTCTGPSLNNCVICGSGTYSFNRSCATTSSGGVCQGSNLIANNNKHECDTCRPKCTSCQVPNFNVASTVDQAQCTGCLPGFVLPQGNLFFRPVPAAQEALISA